MKANSLACCVLAIAGYAIAAPVQESGESDRVPLGQGVWSEWTIATSMINIEPNHRRKAKEATETVMQSKWSEWTIATSQINVKLTHRRMAEGADGRKAPPSSRRATKAHAP